MKVQRGKVEYTYCFSVVYYTLPVILYFYPIRTGSLQPASLIKSGYPHLRPLGAQVCARSESSKNRWYQRYSHSKPNFRRCASLPNKNFGTRHGVLSVLSNCAGILPCEIACKTEGRFYFLKNQDCTKDFSHQPSG